MLKWGWRLHCRSVSGEGMEGYEPERVVIKRHELVESSYAQLLPLQSHWLNRQAVWDRVEGWRGGACFAMHHLHA